MKKHSWLLIIPFVAFLFLAIWGFTRVAIWPTWNLSTSGQIGDAIGGITAPFINLLGAILVYLSFRQQQEANKIQNDALTEERRRTNANDHYNRLVNLIEDLDLTIEGFQYITAGQSGEGLDAFRLFSASGQNLISSTAPPNYRKIVSDYINFLKLTLYIIDNIKAYDYGDGLTNEILKVKLINIIAQVEPYLESTKEKMSTLIEVDNKTIHDYLEEILIQMNSMKNSTTHF